MVVDTQREQREQHVQVAGPKCCDRPDGITGYGAQDAKVVFIGIAPGRDEATKSKRPLTGPSGKLLDAVLLDGAGLRRDEVYCTNLICWWNDAPTKEEIQVCHPRLKSELELIKPKVIVLLGKLACETMLPDLKFGKARGAVIRRVESWGLVYYLPTYHPAASLHKGTTAMEKELQINAAYDLVRDLTKLPRILSSEYEWIEPTYTVIDKFDDAQWLLTGVLPKDRPVALDIETSYDKEHEKYHPFDHSITCIGIGWKEDHCYIIVPPAVSKELVWPTDVQYVYHNGMFDTQEMRRELGVHLPISQDTMLESGMCDERSIRGLHKLKSLQREWIGSDFYEEEEHKTDDELLLYNAKDVCGTVRLHSHLNKWMHDEGTVDVYNNLVLPMSEILAEAQYRGIYVNQNYVGEIARTLGTEFFKLDAELKEFARDVLGAPEFNHNSPIQVKKLMEFQGYPLKDTRKATLQELLEREDIPFVQKLLRYRMLYRLIKVYLLDVTTQVKYDGRVHPHAFLLGTVTGRLSYRAPAMNTLPKEKTVGELGIIRKLFSATNDDYVLLEADYQQIEAWIGQYLSQDQVLLEDMSSGSWHDKTTTDVFGVTKETCTAQEWKFYRDAGKHLNYGCFFEEGPEGLTRRPPIGMGCDMATARAYHTKWFQRYAEYDKWRKRIKLEAQRDGYIQTPFGRKRRFPLVVNDHQLRQMVNSPIQSIANDYTFTANIRMHKRLQELDTHLLFIEHDGTYLEVPKKHLQEVLHYVKETMETPPLPGLPSVPVTIEVGPTLAELKEVHV